MLYQESYQLLHICISSGCSNVKVRNTFLTKFEIMKLKIDAFRMFMIFFKCCTKEFLNRFFPRVTRR